MKAMNPTSTTTSLVSASDHHRRCVGLVEKATLMPDGGSDAEAKYEKASPFDDRPDVERDWAIDSASANHGDVVVGIEILMTMRRGGGVVGFRVIAMASRV